MKHPPKFGGMESIRIWLNGDRKYAAGAKLYLQYGKDVLLKRLFSEAGSSDFKIKKLADVLQVLVSSTPPPPPHSRRINVYKNSGEVKKVLQKFKQEIISSSGWSKQMDDVEAALHAQWKPVFSEMNELCAKVGDLAREGRSDPYKELQAGQMALRILKLEEECYVFYDQREYYQQHGQLPETKPYGEPCIDFELIPSKLENHKRYTRDYRIKLTKEPADLAAAEQLKKHEWFVEYYKKALKKN